MEQIAKLHIEKLPEGVYLATSEDIPDLMRRPDGSRPLRAIIWRAAWSRDSSVTRLLLMTERQNVYCIEIGIVKVERHVPGVTEVDGQFPPAGALTERSADIGRRFQQQQMPLDRLGGSPGRGRVLVGEEPPATLQPSGGALGNRYSWHSGIACSSSVPQVRSQPRASSPVRCRPVS